MPYHRQMQWTFWDLVLQAYIGLFNNELQVWIHVCLDVVQLGPWRGPSTQSGGESDQERKSNQMPQASNLALGSTKIRPYPQAWHWGHRTWKQPNATTNCMWSTLCKYENTSYEDTRWVSLSLPPCTALRQSGPSGSLLMWSSHLNWKSLQSSGSRRPLCAHLTGLRTTASCDSSISLRACSSLTCCKSNWILDTCLRNGPWISRS